MTGAAADRGLLVAELFGPTVQGEGPSCGRQALFIRLSRCNLSCPGCDTPYTWDWARYDIAAETQRLTGDEIVTWALARPTELVVVTGGEPLLQQDRLLPVVAALAAAGRRVEVETNGTIAPRPDFAAAVAAFTVSPKLAAFAATPDLSRRLNPHALQALVDSGRAVFKFVASTVDDLDEIADWQRRFGLAPVWVMPEGVSTGRILAVMQQLGDEVVHRGWNLSTRLHVLLWGDQRGR